MGSGFYIENFGCRAARADGEAIADRLTAQGHRPQPLAQAGVIVVNTCSVTAESDRAARACIRRAHRLNPEARIVVTGCYAQRAPEELSTLAGVVAVVGNSHKALAPEIVLESLREAGVSALAGEAGKSAPALVQIVRAPRILADASFAHSFLPEAQLRPGAQTRPNLKIQEGCSNRCTYCVIPATRGPSRSLPAEAVLAQVRGFVEAGGQELVFTGINLGRWGADLPRAAGEEPATLAGLLRRLLRETDLPRLRLSSVEPMDWRPELLSLFAGQRAAGGARLARHAHLPLQSGSDAVLRRMHRRYRPWHYERRVEELMAAAGPELTLGADVMVGFPGESEAEFAETLAFVERLPFATLHLFPFSPRPGTAAAALQAAQPVRPEAVAERMQALRALAGEKSRRHRAQFVGRSLAALTLHTPAALVRRGRSAALSDNFLPLELAGRLEANRPVQALVEGVNEEGVLLARPDPAPISAPLWRG